MSLPDHVLSTVLVPGYFLVPDNMDSSPIRDYELGGVALNDPSQGLRVRVWYIRLRVDGIAGTSTVYIGSEGLPAVPETVFMSVPETITDVSLAFDQNMQPAVGYVVGGVTKLFWYDTALPGYTTTTFAGAGVPRLCLDDKRASQTGTSDILMFYTRAGNLYYREQRDRFTVEYLLKAGVVGQVIQCGMTHVNRVQIVVGLQDYPTPELNYRTTVDGRNRTIVGGGRRQLVGASYG